MKKILKVIEKVQREVVLVGGVVITVGEILVTSLPKGTAQTALRIALPIVVTVVQRTRTVPVGMLTQIAAAIEKRAAAK